MARDYYRDPVSGNLIAKTVKVEDTLPVGTEVDYDGSTIPEGWVEVDDPNEYSTTETVVGKWIDGRDIYKKTVVFHTISIVNNAYFNHNIPNIDEIIYSKIVFSDQPNGSSYTSIASDADGYIVFYADKTKIICSGTGNWGARNNRYLYATLYYVKATT